MTEGGDFIPFEAVDHTADLAFVARGRSLEELFQNAASGMVSFLVDPATIRPEVEELIEVEGYDPEERLINWLQEILYRLEVRGRIYGAFRVESAGPVRVRAICRGEALDPARHTLLVDVKAATYHDLAITREPSPAGQVYRARIVLDI